MEPHRRLQSWLEATGKPQVELARECDYPPPNFNKIVKGKIRPTLKLAFAIEEATSGAIPASAWAEAA